MNDQVTEAQLFELLGRLYVSRELLRLQLEIMQRASLKLDLENAKMAQQKPRDLTGSRDWGS